MLDVTTINDKILPDHNSQGFSLFILSHSWDFPLLFVSKFSYSFVLAWWNAILNPAKMGK